MHTYKEDRWIAKVPCSVAGANIECKFNFPCVEGILHRLSLRVEGGLKTDRLLLLLLNDPLFELIHGNRRSVLIGNAGTAKSMFQ